MTATGLINSKTRSSRALTFYPQAQARTKRSLSLDKSAFDYPEWLVLLFFISALTLRFTNTLNTGPSQNNKKETLEEDGHASPFL